MKLYCFKCSRPITHASRRYFEMRADAVANIQKEIKEKFGHSFPEFMLDELLEKKRINTQILDKLGIINECCRIRIVNGDVNQHAVRI